MTFGLTFSWLAFGFSDALAVEFNGFYEATGTSTVWRPVNRLLSGGSMNPNAHVFVRATLSDPFPVWTPVQQYAEEATRLVAGAEPGSTNVPAYPGTNFTFVEAAPGGTSCDPNNFVNEICSFTNGWFIGRGIAGAPYELVKNTFGYVDIVLNRDAIAWSTSSTLDAPAGQVSIIQVLTHALTHRIGLGHENDVIALTNENYPHGGALGWAPFGTAWNGAALNEDDYVGYLATKPGLASTSLPHKARCSNPIVPGPEVALTRYVASGGSGSGNATLNWSTGFVTYDKSSGWVTPPPPVGAVYRGCGADWTTVEWRVGTDTLCSTANIGTSVVGFSSPTQVANGIFSIQPYGWDFSGVDPGNYRLCALIVDGATGVVSDDLVRSTSTSYVRVVP